MNYTIVAMEDMEFSEACHVLGHMVKEHAAKISAEGIDKDVHNYLVKT